VTTWWLCLILAIGLTPQSADLVRRSQSAAQAMEKGAFDDAARIYRELVQAVPGDAGLWMNLGMALAMGGHEADAIGPLERAVKLKATLIPAHLFLGTSYLALEKPDQAIPPLRKVVAAQPSNLEYRQMLARAYAAAGRAIDAAVELRRATDLAPNSPRAWYALFEAYNAVAQDAIASFQPEPESSAWRQLLVADALMADGRYTDAFAIFRDTLEAMPAMATIRDSIATIYEKTGHADWAAVERGRVRISAAECARRKALCEFRAGRHRAALAAARAGSDAESRYLRARAATALGNEAFKRLDALPDSRERRELRAALASGDRRYSEAVTELRAALTFAPDDLSLKTELGVALYHARDYEQAMTLLAPVVNATPHVEDSEILTAYADSLLQLDRVDDAIPILRRAFTADTSDPAASLALARAYIRQREFRAALPLLEWQLAGDADGSVHVLLSRALAGMEQPDKAEAALAKSREIQEAAQQRAAEAGKRAITPPK
jgi:tetratricopeptide (TPR) repeat protein